MSGCSVCKGKAYFAALKTPLDVLMLIMHAVLEPTDMKVSKNGKKR